MCPPDPECTGTGARLDSLADRRVVDASMDRRVVLLAAAAVALLGAPVLAAPRCRCLRPYAPRCPGPAALHRLTVAVDLAVRDGTVEVLTQTGPYQVPAGDLDGKQVLFVVTPRNVVFQGFFSDVIPGSLGVGAFQGTGAVITTAPAFAPGEYELALFADVAPGGGGLGPQRGDLAAFDNGVCDPTGVTVRFRVGCEDATVTLTNRHFIIF